MSVTCPGCGRVVGTYRNGKIRPHYAATGSGLCSGAYTVPSPPRDAVQRALRDGARST